MTLLRATQEQVDHCREWAALIAAEGQAKDGDNPNKRNVIERERSNALGHLGELLLSRDFELEWSEGDARDHRCLPKILRGDNGYDMVVAGRRIEVKACGWNSATLIERHEGDFDPERQDLIVLLRETFADGSLVGLEALGVIDPATFNARAGYVRIDGSDRRVMTARELGSYDLLAEILTTPELAEAAWLNGRPPGGWVSG